jgi:hypothetical protein
LLTHDETRAAVDQPGTLNATRSSPRRAFAGNDRQPLHLPWLIRKTGELLQVLTRGLEGVPQVDPWTTSFQPATITLERLVELVH